MGDGLSALLFDLYRGSRRVEPEAFQQWAFSLIQKIVPFDSGSWVSGVLLEQGPVVHSCYLYNLPDQIMVDYLHIWEEDPLYRRMQDAMGSSANLSGPDYTTATLQAHIKKFNIGHALGTRVADTVMNMRTSICWFRAPNRQPFSEEERLFKQQLMPHLVEAWAESRVNYALKSNNGDHRSNHATAVADGKFVLHFADELFGELITDEWSDWRGPNLPAPISAHLAQQPTQALTGNAIVVTASKMCDGWLLRARRKSAYDELGKREREVARLITAGLSRKQIANSLGISPATVNNHMAAIYEKLGIGDKVRLAKILSEFE